MRSGGVQTKIYKIGRCFGPAAIARRSLSWKRAYFDARAFLVETAHGSCWHKADHTR